MPTPSRRMWMLLLLACLGWHAMTLHRASKNVARDRTGRDFASYYYAVQVAFDGGDPYDKSALVAKAKADPAKRGGVHPFFYPPPYLLTMAWVRPMSLRSAYQVWFWLDALMALAVVLLLWRWWRPLGSAVPAALALSLVALTALPNNHLMGQMNLPPLLLTLLALRDAESGRDVRAGAAMGLACMMKMSPAFFVMWWLLQRRFRPAVFAVVSAIVLSLAALPLVGWQWQWRFFTEVLPGFGSGRYNGLGVGIDLFGNHSLPNLYDTWFPAGRAHLMLSDTARMLSSATMLTMVFGTGWLLRHRPSDALATAGHIGAIACVMLLVPVYTYEHHLVWMWPAAVVAVAGLQSGRLSRAWIVPLVFAWGVWCADLAMLKAMWQARLESQPMTAFALRELKFLSLVVLYVAALRVARSAPEQEPA